MPAPDLSSPNRLQLYAAWSNEALVLKLKEGDEKAFREIYDRYAFNLFRAATNKVSSTEIAEEIVQEVFVSLWDKRETSRIEQLSAYLYTAVKYSIIDYYKDEQRRTNYLSVERNMLSELDYTTEHAVAAEDLSRTVAVCVQNLPEQTRLVYHMSRTEHLSVAEIAERLRLSPKTVEYHLTKALKQLRTSLKDFLPLLLFWLINR